MSFTSDVPADVPSVCQSSVPCSSSVAVKKSLLPTTASSLGYELPCVLISRSRLVPADSPTLTPLKPDWHLALNEALARRPELLLARQDLKFRELDLIRVRNNLLPDLRFSREDDPATGFKELVVRQN